MDKPKLSEAIWGDVNADSIDYEKQALYVIETIFDHGSLDDIFSIREFYGDKRIIKEIIHTKELGSKEVNFCCVLLKIDPKDFKYPTNKPAYPEPWDYSGA